MAKHPITIPKMQTDFPALSSCAMSIGDLQTYVTGSDGKFCFSGRVYREFENYFPFLNAKIDEIRPTKYEKNRLKNWDKIVNVVI